MSVKLPRDIEALVMSRVSSGEFASAEDVVRSAMAPWIERESKREQALNDIRGKIAEGEADETEFSAEEVRDYLNRAAAGL